MVLSGPRPSAEMYPECASLCPGVLSFSFWMHTNMETRVQLDADKKKNVYANY